MNKLFEYDLEAFTEISDRVNKRRITYKEKYQLYDSLFKKIIENNDKIYKSILSYQKYYRRNFD